MWLCHWFVNYKLPSTDGQMQDIHSAGQRRPVGLRVKHDLQMHYGQNIREKTHIMQKTQIKCK